MPFSNPLVAGETILQNVESENYVAGVDGWRVEKDGDAEFNDVTVRGTVDIVGANGSLTLDVDVTDEPEIKFTAPNGDTYSIQADNTALDIGFTNLSGRSSLHIVDGEGIALRSSQVGAPSILFDDDDGYVKRGSYAPWTINGWINPGNLNLWTGTVEYKVLPHGEVIFRGALAGGTNVVGTQLVNTMPAGLRPGTTCRFETPTGAIDAGGRVQMSTLGGLVIARLAGSASFYLDSVRYLVV